MALTKVPSNLDATVATTQSASDNSTNVATTAYVTTAISNLSDSAPAALNTLNEIAAALGDDANYASTTTAAIAAKLPLAGGTLTGALVGTSSTMTGGFLGGSNGGIRIHSGGTKFFNITAANAARDNIMDIGASDARFKDLYLGGNTQIAGNLDVVGQIGAYNNPGSSWGTMGLRATDYTFKNAGGTIKVTFDSNGNVGIGANSISSWAKLQVAGTAGAQDGAKQALYIQSPTTTANEGVGIRMSAASGSHEAVGIIGMVNNASGNAGAMTFHTYNLGATIPEAMRITNTGDLLVGGTTNLDVLSGTPKIQVGDGTGHSSMQFWSGTSSVGGLYFGDATSGGDRYPGYIEYRHNNNSFGFAASGAGALEIRSDRLDVARSSNEARITINNEGTAGTNNSNWIRGSGTVLMYNSAGSDHRWEIGGTQHMELKANQSASVPILSLTDAHPWIDMVAPDNSTWKSGITMRGGSSSTQAQCHFHMTRDSGYRTLSTAGDYDAYIDTTTANSAAYGDFLIGTDNVERSRITAYGAWQFYAKHQGDSVGHFIFSNQIGGDSTSTNCTLMVKNGNAQIQIMGWSTLGARIGTRGGGWNSNSNNDVHFTRNDGMQIKLGGSGPVLSNGTAISSDERLKKNITDIADGQLAKINALKVRTFEWKNTDTLYAGTQEGFIAQEVESVIPEAVKEETMAPDPHDTSRDFEGDVKLLKHEVINARLIKAVQELSSELEAAKARIAALEG